MEQIDLKLISSDQGVDKKVLEVYEYLKIYKEASARIAWIENYGKNWDAIENKIWTGKEEKAMEKEGQIPLSISKCAKGVQGSCAIVTDQKPEMKFFPIGSGDLYVAELLKRGFDVIWEKNEGSDVVYDLSESVKIGAHGFLYIKLDKSKNPFGTIVIDEETPDDIYWDKDSRKRDYSDTHLIKAKPRTLEYIKENYPDVKEDDLYFLPVEKNDDETSSGITTGDNYAEGTSEPDSIDPDVKARQKIIWEIEAWLLKTYKEDWAVEIDEDGKPKVSMLKLKDDQKPNDLLNDNQKHWPRIRTKRVQRIIVGKKLVSEKINPEGEDADGDPVINLVGLKGQRTRTAYAMSDTDYARDLNKSKCKRRIQAIHAASHLINAPLWWLEGVEWTGNPGTPGSHAKVSKNTAIPAIGRVPSGALDIGHYMRLEERDDQEIDEIYNMQDVMKGKMPKGQEQVSGKLVLALQDLGGMMNKPFLRRLESTLVRAAKVVVSMMFKHWQRYMWERLLEDEERLSFAPEGTDEEKELMEIQEGNYDQETEIKEKIAAKWEKAIELIRPKDINQSPGLSLIDLDVKITAGSSMPTNRIAKGQMSIEYVNAGIYDAEAALEYVDDPNKDKIVARLKKRQEAEIKAGMMKK